VSGLGPSFIKIWTCGSFPRSGSRNAWPRIININGARRIEQILEFFRRHPNDFLSRLVTMDEIWLYHYDTEKKQQSVEWRHWGSPHPKIIPSAKICWKISRLNFLYQDGILIVYLPKGQTINPEYYSSLLVQLKNIIKEKRRGKVTKGVLFLHDNAPAHRALATQKKLAYLGFQCLDHPPYSPDLATSDYQLFLGLKKTIERSSFFRPTRTSLLPRRLGWTDNFLNFFLSGLQKLEQRAKKCIELRGECVE